MQSEQKPLSCFFFLIDTFSVLEAHPLFIRSPVLETLKAAYPDLHAGWQFLHMVSAAAGFETTEAVCAKTGV